MIVLKKWHVVSVVAAILLIAMTVITVHNVNAFQNVWVEDVYVDARDYRFLYGDYYEVTEEQNGDTVTQEYTVRTEVNQKVNHTASLKNAVVSNVYMFRYLHAGTRMQIRLRVAYYLPFMHEDMFSESTIKVTDADGKELNCNISAAPDTTAGFHGMKIALKFEEADFPQPGETIYFFFSAATAENPDEAYASGKIAIEMV